MSIDVNSVSLCIEEVEILKNITLKINPGELVTILGPNGSGKSSLLKIISGDMMPSKGTIFMDSTPLNKIDVKKQALKRAVMSQSQEILYDYTVREIIEMGWVYEEILENDIVIKNKCIKVAHECHIIDLLNRTFNTLSGGEQRRVHFARTLLQINHNYDKVGSRYMLLDEPTANLDLSYELKLIELLKAKSQEGIGILLIIHDLNLARKFSNKIAILNNGCLCAFGAPSDVFKSELLTEIFNLPMQVDPETLQVSYY